MLMGASQVSAIPIVSQGSAARNAAAIGQDALLPQAPPITFANSLHDSSSPSFARLITAFATVNSGSDTWWDPIDRPIGKNPGRGKKIGQGPGNGGGGGGGNPSPVPEPATMLLFGAGLVGLAIIKKRV
ncbi:MAG TPA: hypothetical protein DDY20_06405 [Desulfobulbaceae bacterium]|nr:hypothetical protein [Desulfobulbaceae bacterium]